MREGFQLLFWMQFLTSTFVAGDATQEVKVELHGFCKEPFTLSVSLFRVLEVPLPVDEEAKPDGWREHYEVYESTMQPN